MMPRPRAHSLLLRPLQREGVAEAVMVEEGEFPQAVRARGARCTAPFDLSFSGASSLVRRAQVQNKKQ